jgi:predicted AlkP superfamily phosphohydrolase/phosphomutase
VLIGLDGATFSVLDPLMEQGVMPFLKQLGWMGARAELRSVVPPLTPPAWTSLVTGRSPGHHGVFDFFLKEEKSAHIRFATSRDVPCETVWSIANRNECRVTALNYPLMMPPPRLDGHVVAGGWMTPRQLRLGCSPDTLFDSIKTIPGFDPKKVAMDMAQEEKALEGCDRKEYEGWIQMHIEREEQWFGILNHLMSTEPSGLTAVLFDGVDKIQHLCWRFLGPEWERANPEPWEQRVREAVLAYFSRLDRLLAEIETLAGPDATLLITSDHGFGAQTMTFFANAWLESEGLLAWADSAPPGQNDAAALGMGQLARHVTMLDWEKTKAYAATPSSNGIHIVTAEKPSDPGVPAAEYESFRKQLIDSLYGLQCPGTGERLVKQIWTREEAFDGPFLNRAPDLTLELADGGLVSILGSDAPVKLRDQPSGTHRPLGVFLAKGPGIQGGFRADELSILDVAPTLLHSLGLPIPEDMEGRVVEEIFDPDSLEECPVRYVGAAAPKEAVPSKTSDNIMFDADAEAEMAKRLRALGYIE